MGGDGQVTVGNTVMKGNARKGPPPLRRQGAGGLCRRHGTDAFTLFERFEGKLEKYGQPDARRHRGSPRTGARTATCAASRRCSASRTRAVCFVISGNGDVIEPGATTVDGRRLRRAVRARRGARLAANTELDRARASSSARSASRPTSASTPTATSSSTNWRRRKHGKR